MEQWQCPPVARQQLRRTIQTDMVLRCRSVVPAIADPYTVFNTHSYIVGYLQLTEVVFSNRDAPYSAHLLINSSI